MSKIVCDVCGSTYSETEAQCPICGTAKSEAAKPIVEANAEDQAAKGGKFSRTNTRRSGTGSPRKSGADKNKEEGAPSNIAMIVIVAVLLLAIVSVCVFIAVRLINRPEPDPSGSSSSTPPVVQQIPCTGIELVGNPDSSLSFTDLTQTAQLNVKALPENTTDIVTYTYSSSDPTVVTVDDNGLVTPVANGTATVTVTYGSYTISVSVTCDIPAPITELVLAHSDVTLRAPNYLTVSLYNGELDPADITWTSSDETIATVDNGVVTGGSNGTATITAVYGELSASCKVIVKGFGETAEYVVASKWGDSDTTLQIGETIEFFLADKATGEKVTENVEWIPSADFTKCCTYKVTENGVEITGTAVTSNVAGKFVYIKAKYNGQLYRLIVRVKAAAEG